MSVGGIPNAYIPNNTDGRKDGWMGRSSPGGGSSFFNSEISETAVSACAKSIKKFTT